MSLEHVPITPLHVITRINELLQLHIARKCNENLTHQYPFSARGKKSIVWKINSYCLVWQGFKPLICWLSVRHANSYIIRLLFCLFCLEYVTFNKIFRGILCCNGSRLIGKRNSLSGKFHGAVLTNNQDWEDASVSAGIVSGDLIHPLPFTPELHFSEFASAVADMKNSVAVRSYLFSFPSLFSCWCCIVFLIIFFLIFYFTFYSVMIFLIIDIIFIMTFIIVCMLLVHSSFLGFHVFCRMSVHTSV